MRVTWPDGPSRAIIGDQTPTMPWKAYGRIDAIGWDIPNYWAIDADNQCWLDDSGHGMGLRPCTSDDIYACFKSEDALAAGDFWRVTHGFITQAQLDAEIKARDRLIFEALKVRYDW